MRIVENKQIEARAKEFKHRTLLAIMSIVIDKNFMDAAKALSACQNKIVTTGMGKAGHAARKAASTFCSLNLPAVYLHPGEASHGDAGILTKNDILLAFSTSGKTREVIEVAQLAKHLGIERSIAITSHPDAPLRKVCDIEVNMGVVEEAGYLHIAPTTSITIMLVISDMLATIAAELRGVTMHDFALRHHGGYLGRKSQRESKKSKNQKPRS